MLFCLLYAGFDMSDGSACRLGEGEPIAQFSNRNDRDELWRLGPESGERVVVVEDGDDVVLRAHPESQVFAIIGRAEIPNVEGERYFGLGE